MSSKLRLQIDFNTSLNHAAEMARQIAEAAGLGDVMVRFGQAAKGNLEDVYGFYLEGQTALGQMQNTVQSLMSGCLKSAGFELRDTSSIVPMIVPKDVWHVRFDV